MAAVKIFNFLANDDRTFDGCSNGITPFCIPWQLAEAVNSDMVVKRYLQEAIAEISSGYKNFATGAKFDPPQMLHGLTRIFTNYIRLLEVLFGDQCHYLHWVLRLRDGLDLHERSLQSRVTHPS